MTKNTSKGSIYIIFLLFLALLTIKVVKSCNQQGIGNKSESVPATIDHKGNAKGSWRSRKLIFTEHARCRMDCRKISEGEILLIQQTGIVNYRKSNLNDTPCATYAVEGSTPDGQQVRIVFGVCQKNTTVITCIDLGMEHPCICP